MEGTRARPEPPAGATEDREAARSVGRYAGLGLQFAASIVLFLYAGQWVDRRAGTAPWGTLVGVFVGAGAAFGSMYHRLMDDLRRDEARRRRGS